MNLVDGNGKSTFNSFREFMFRNYGRYFGTSNSALNFFKEIGYVKDKREFVNKCEEYIQNRETKPYLRKMLKNMNTLELADVFMEEIVGEIERLMNNE